MKKNPQFALVAIIYASTVLTVLATEEIDDDYLANHQPLPMLVGGAYILIEPSSYGAGLTAANGQYYAKVTAITVRYPEGWRIVSVQLVGKKLFVTLDTRTVGLTRVSETFWFDPHSKVFVDSVRMHIAKSFKRKEKPTMVQIVSESLTVRWRSENPELINATAKNAIRQGR